MKKNNKKGFTIVELVIVIAVIAILAAVLIPTFSSIIKKAKVNNDIGTIANLNKGLAIAQATDGTPKTMTEVLAAAEDIGYTVEKLTPTAEDYYYCWNQNENKFFLVNDEFKPYDDTISYNANNSYWMIIHDATELSKVQGASTKFCLYFAYNPTTAGNPMFTASVGVDTGNYDFDLKYAGTIDNVTIRTNGGDLTVNSTTGTIYHYGKASLINIIECDDNSYHENGKVDEIKLAKGRVVVESNGEVGSVMVTATDVNNIKIENNGTLGGVAANNDTAAPDLKNKVTGVDENKVLTEAVDNSEFAGGLGTETSPYLIATNEQFAAINSFSAEMSGGKAFYFKQIADINLVFTNESTSIVDSFCGIYNGSNYNINIITQSSGDRQIFKKAVKDAKFTNINLRLDDNLVSFCDYKTRGTRLVLDNVDIYGETGNSYYLGQNSGVFFGWTGTDAAERYEGYEGSIEMTNCDVVLDAVSDNYTAIFVGGGNYLTDVVLDNCTYDGSFYGTQISFVLGNSSDWWARYEHTVTVKNCKNYGKIYGTVRAAFIGGSGELNDAQKAKLTLANNVEGTIATINDTALGIDVSNNCYRIKQGGKSAVSYKIQLTGGTRRINAGAENSSFTFTLDLGKLSFDNGYYVTNYYVNGYLATVEQYKSEVDNAETFSGRTKYTSEEGYEFFMILKDGKCYYVFDFGGNSDIYFCKKQDGAIISSIVEIKSVAVLDYNEEGTLLGMVKTTDPHTTIEG